MSLLSKTILVIAAFAALAALPFQKKKVIFFGDSITEAGVKPGGYITMMREMIKNSSSDSHELLEPASEEIKFTICISAWIRTSLLRNQMWLSFM